MLSSRTLPPSASPVLVPPPDDASLHAAALAHLARYATTQTGLTRVLERRVDRWARAAGVTQSDPATKQAKHTVREVVARLAAAGVLDDRAFATARARRLTQSGRSRRAVAAYLAARGIGQADTEAALAGHIAPSPSAADGGSEAGAADDSTGELASALVLARRRRIGPFRIGSAGPDVARKELGIMARAGFPHDIALSALRMGAEDAQAMVTRLRRA